MRFYDLHFPRAIHPHTIRIPPRIYLTQEVDLNRIFKSKHPGYYIGVVLLRLAAGKAHKDGTDWCGTGFCCGAGSGHCFQQVQICAHQKWMKQLKLCPKTDGYITENPRWHSHTDRVRIGRLLIHMDASGLVVVPCRGSTERAFGQASTFPPKSIKSYSMKFKYWTMSLQPPTHLQRITGHRLIMQSTTKVLSG